MNTRIPLLILALATGVLTGWTIRGASSRADGAVKANIETLQSDPDGYSNKLVEVSGRLTECYEWECSLCPETMTAKRRDPDRCLALEFRPLMPGTGFGVAEQEALFRFASVTLQAKFDPNCWKVPCLDRPVVLHDAQVHSVATRRKSVEGLWIGDTTPIGPASRQVSGQVIAAAHLSGFPKQAPIKVLQPLGDTQTAIACWAHPGLDERGWPSTTEAALYAKTINDFYSCSTMRLENKTWILQTGLQG